MNGTIHNREQFLQKIAGRLGRQPIQSGGRPEQWAHNPQDTVLKDADGDQLLEVLKNQCRLIHTDLLVTKKAELQATLQKLVDEYGGGPIVSWKDERFAAFGLHPLFKDIWPSEGIEVHEWDHSQGKTNIQSAEKANIGLAISDITLAESGTAVLFTGKDKGRTVSFLPLQSIVLMPKSTLVPRMTQAARIMRDKMKNNELTPSCVQFITGPSNSADIELNLVVGVHGPVKMAYVVIDDL